MSNTTTITVRPYDSDADNVDYVESRLGASGTDAYSGQIQVGEVVYRRQPAPFSADSDAELNLFDGDRVTIQVDSTAVTVETDLGVITFAPGVHLVVRYQGDRAEWQARNGITVP